MQINELLARRTDLSTFLVHMTRATAQGTAKQNLINVIDTNLVCAVSPFGAASSALQAAGLSTESQRCACFTETPLEHVSLLTCPIDGRDIKFEPYGVAITRKQGRLRGVNPVWYLDMTPGHSWLTEPMRNLVEGAIEIERRAGEPFDMHPIARLAPFIDWMGVWETGRKEFWWEREWRHCGHFALPDTYIVLCPAADMPEIGGVVAHKHADEFGARVSFVDPAWSLEKIIGSLAGFGDEELGPF